MKKIITIILAIMLNVSILGNTFAGYSEPVKGKTEQEISKEIGINLQTLKDVNFNFEGYDIGMIQNDKEGIEKIKKSIIEQTKLYKSLVSGKENLQVIESKSFISEEIAKKNLDIESNSNYNFIYKCEFIQNNKYEKVGIGCYTYFSQEGMPGDYGYKLFTMSKNSDHLIIKSTNLLNLEKVISSKKMMKLNQLILNKDGTTNTELFKNIFDKIMKIITTNKGLTKIKNDFIKENLDSQKLN